MVMFCITSISMLQEFEPKPLRNVRKISKNWALDFRARFWAFSSVNMIEEYFVINCTNGDVLGLQNKRGFKILQCPDILGSSLVFPQSNCIWKFQNNFKREFRRTYWFRTSAPTIALKFIWHTICVNKNWNHWKGGVDLSSNFGKNIYEQSNRISGCYCWIIAADFSKVSHPSRWIKK